MNTRKAAILIATLDTHTADALLGQMEPDEAASVRRAVLELDHVDDAERAAVIDEFFASAPAGGGQDSEVKSTAPASQAGVELDESLRRRLAQNASMDDVPEPAPPEVEPFEFLHDAAPDQVAGALSGESPQTAALVLSHVTPDHAARIIDQFDTDFQRDVLHRLVHLEQSHPEVVGEVHQGLKSRVAAPTTNPQPSTSGRELIQRILDAADDGLQRRIVRHLGENDPTLAETFARPPITLGDLDRLSRAEWLAVLERTGEDVFALALLAVPTDFARRVLTNFAPHLAQRLQKKTLVLGPTPLSDLEAALHAILATTENLITAGQIRITSTPAASFVA